MGGFTATGTAPAQAPIQPDDFWPAIDPDAIRAFMRLDASIKAPALRHALIIAAIQANGELARWAQPHRAAGIEHLAEIPASQVDGLTRLEHLYLRAVACLAAAHVHEQYRSHDATGSGHQHADAQTPRIDELRRDARWAIRDLKGQTRTTVDLI